MENIELEPKYSTVELPGRCLKCLAEQEYGDCLKKLLRGEDGKKQLEDKFEAIITLLKSSELVDLRNELERHLSNGENAKLIINIDEGKPKYNIKID